MGKRNPPYSGLYNCKYCGRFIAWGDFADGKADTGSEDYWNGIDPETYEEIPVAWHKACKEKCDAHVRTLNEQEG